MFSHGEKFVKFWNYFKPWTSAFLTDCSKAVLLLWIWVCLWHIVEPVSCSFVVTWWERDDLLPLLCVMFSCFLSLSHSISWFRCGTWLYLFLIFAFCLTLVEGIIRNILWNYFYFIGIILNFHISDIEHFLGCTFMTRFVQSSSYIHINVLIRFLTSHFFQ